MSHYLVTLFLWEDVQQQEGDCLKKQDIVAVLPHHHESVRWGAHQQVAKPLEKSQIRSVDYTVNQGAAQHPKLQITMPASGRGAGSTPSPWDTEASGYLWVQDQSDIVSSRTHPGLCRERLSYLHNTQISAHQHPSSSTILHRGRTMGAGLEHHQWSGWWAVVNTEASFVLE